MNEQMDTIEIPENLSEEALHTLHHDIEHFSHNLAREITSNRLRAKRRAALKLLEAFIFTTTGQRPAKIDSDVVHHHAHFDEAIDTAVAMSQSRKRN